MVGSSSNASEERKVIDATVGGLVWVRRRNGSWWPGQIVGPDELPEDGLASTRSGTPIKLLCRDDSSVDWFDLEKTKGVKAFRCGDYDTCIEKAKVTAAKSSRRTSIKPNRENAIICALEIERSNLFKDCPNPDHESVGANGAARSSECSSNEETTSEREDNSTSTQELSNSGLSYEETNGPTCNLKGQPLKARRRKTPNDSEDDGTEGIKRMKGLDDLGIGVDKKVPVLALANPVPQSSALGSVANGGSTATFKRKRSQVVHIHELLKRKYRRRPLTKVLENSTMVPVRIICDEFATPFERYYPLSTGYECENGDKELFNGQLLLEDGSSDMLVDVPFVDEGLDLPGYSPVWQPSSPSKPHPSSFKSFQVNQMVGKSASEWQLKGKRNARHLSKPEELHPRRRADIDHNKLDDYMLSVENPSRFSPNSSGLTNGFTDLRTHVSLSSSQRPFSYHHPHFLLQDSFDLPDVPTGSVFINSSLYEVEIAVEATRPQHHTQHVPYISLMSRLNGKPITGHPVTVEVLEDGFCDLEIFYYFPASGSCSLDDEEPEMVPARSRRMKNLSVLRPHRPHKKKSSNKSKASRSKSSKSKRHGPTSKKTRKLSSLTGPRKLNTVKRKTAVQTPKGPTLACVPLKVVFSRINEALSSARSSAHRALTLQNT